MIKMEAVRVDVLKDLSWKEIDAYRIILKEKIITLDDLNAINVSYGGAVGRLKQKNLVEIIPLESDPKIKCVVLKGVVPV